MFKAACLGLLVMACDGVENTIVDQNDAASVDVPADTGSFCLMESATDYFAQEIPGKMDVLFVVDNSGSMKEEQEQLAKNFSLFLDYFQELEHPIDYHMGVVTTDMVDRDQRGKLREVAGQDGVNYRYIAPDTPDADVIFSSMVKVGIEGTGCEKGFDAVYYALKRQTDYNAGFWRETAGLHIIVVSDEEDCSSTSKENFANWLVEVGRSHGQVSFSSIIPLAPDCGAATVGESYLYVTGLVGGFSYPICRDDWSETLADMGNQLVQLKKEFFLSRAALEETIEVAVTDANGATYGVKPTAYEYDAVKKSVKFEDDQVPPEGSTITVAYDTEVCEDH